MPNFPECPSSAPTNCNGNPDSPCSAYCTAVKRCDDFGEGQYETAPHCCALCASIVGNTSDKSTLCCRADALNERELSKAACTKAGPFGTSTATDVGCGSEVGQVCGLVFHACSNIAPPPACSATSCALKFAGAQAFTYKAGDQSPNPAHAMTLALQALVTPAANQQGICDNVYDIVCP
jgi:hypothetical protein